jgi:predicted permease
VWLRLLERLVPAGEGGQVREELERLYRARVERHGAGAADRWLRRQVLAFVPGAASRLLGSLGLLLTGSVSDVGRAWRTLLRSPGLAAVVVLTLGLGIGASTLVFTMVEGVLLRPLPFREPDRLVDVWNAMTRGELAGIRERTRTLADLRGYIDGGAGVNLEHGGEAYRLATTFVEPGLFALLGARPLLGRLFAAEELDPGRMQVTVLGEGLWRSMFGADPGIVGQAIILDGRPYQVVGVLPASWRFPDPADRLWIPMPWNPASPGPFWGSGGVYVVGRLAAGQSAAAAQQELRGFSAGLAAANPIWSPAPDYRGQTEVTPLREALVGDVRSMLLVLVGAVGLVLLVVCANVSSLLLARALERSTGVAVRAALGASRARVAREALAESTLLGVTGAFVGVLLARGGLALLRPALVGRLPRAEALGVNATVLTVAVAAGIAAGIAAGLLPALRSSRRDPGEALRAAGRGGGPGARRRSLSRLLVAAQVAAAVVLVTSAMLLVRTLAAVGAVDPGFRADRLLTAEVTFPSTRPEASAVSAYAALIDGTRAVPGVDDVALAGSIPFGTVRDAYATFIENVTADPNDLPVFDVDRVSPSYFGVMGIPVLEGRAFRDADRPDAPLVAIVDESMARAQWPDESAIGKRIRYPWAGAPWIEVVGVVGSVADDDLTAPRQPRWYVPLAQRPAPNITLLIASTLPGTSVMPAVRRAVAEVDAALPVSHEAAYTELLGESASRTHLTARVLLLFALATLFLGCLGVYGLAAHAVRERRREIGVRMALGAGSATIGAAVLREGLMVAGPGALVGLLLAAAGTRALTGMLYGVTALDPMTFLFVPVLMLAAALAAMWVPARRAARVDPVESLRAG